MNEVYEQEYTNERNWSLENILSFFSENIKKTENNEFIFYNVYVRLTDDRKIRLEKELKSKFEKDYKAIDFHYPEIIITENIDSVYYVGLDEYDKNIEYFTVRVEK